MSFVSPLFRGYYEKSALTIYNATSGEDFETLNRYFVTFPGFFYLSGTIFLESSDKSHTTKPSAAEAAL